MSLEYDTCVWQGLIFLVSPECGTCVWQGLGPAAGRGMWGLSSTAHCWFCEGQYNGRDDLELL